MKKQPDPPPTILSRANQLYKNYLPFWQARDKDANSIQNVQLIAIAEAVEERVKGMEARLKELEEKADG